MKSRGWLEAAGFETRRPAKRVLPYGCSVLQCIAAFRNEVSMKSETFLLQGTELESRSCSSRHHLMESLFRSKSLLVQC
jgi:hypothetical protein